MNVEDVDIIMWTEPDQQMYRHVERASKKCQSKNKVHYVNESMHNYNKDTYITFVIDSI